MKFLICAAVVAATATALAAPEKREKVAVLELSIEGDADPSLRTQLDKSLAGGLYAAGYDVVGRDVVDKKLKGARELVGCLSTTCLERIGKLVGADRFVRARVEAAGHSYTVELFLYSAEASGGLVARVEKACNAACMLDDANDLMSKGAVELFQKPVHVVIATTPPGATITVDDKSLGASPQAVDLPRGMHHIAAALADHKPYESTISVEGEGEQKVAITLDPMPTKAPDQKPIAVEPPPSRTRFGVWKWAAVGGSVALLATGIAFLSVDGQTTDCPASAGPTQCASSYHTAAPGWLFTGAGVAAAGAAIYMFVFDKPVPSTMAGVVPTTGGASFFVRMAF